MNTRRRGGGKGDVRGIEGREGLTTCRKRGRKWGRWTHQLYMSLHEGQITSKVPHIQHSPHRSLTLCPLHTREHDRK